MDTAGAQANARGIYQDALKHMPDDYFLHENFAEFLESIGDLKQAVSEWQQACQLSPHNPFAFCQAGRCWRAWVSSRKRKPRFPKPSHCIPATLKPGWSWASHTLPKAGMNPP